MKINPNFSVKLSVEGASGGFILYAVLVIVLLSSMVAISLLYETKSYETAASAGDQGEQAYAVAMSGIQRAIQVALSAKSGSTEWQDNEEMFKHQLVFEDGNDSWYYTIYDLSTSEESEGNIVYGLRDEAGKLNLLYLPPNVETNMDNLTLFQALKETSQDNYGLDLTSDVLAETTDLLSETMDFSDGLADSENTEDSGEKKESATSSNTSTNKTRVSTLIATNKAPEYEFLDLVVEEMGFNTKVLYGKDLDMNFQADSGTDETGDIFQEGTASGDMGMGLRHWLTTASYDLNVDSTGGDRINLNDTNATISSLNLSEETTAFIEAMWRSGKKIEGIESLLEATEKLKDEDGKEKEYSVALNDEEMETLYDSCTTESGRYLPGLININTAPIEVLEVLPGFDETLSESITSAREGLTEEDLGTPFWPLRQGLLNKEQIKAIMPFVTTRSYQFHFHVAGYSVPSGRYRVMEVIIDVAQDPPAIVQLRDLTRLGMPFKVEASGEDITTETDTDTQIGN